MLKIRIDYKIDNDVLLMLLEKYIDFDYVLTKKDFIAWVRDQVTQYGSYEESLIGQRYASQKTAKIASNLIDKWFS